MNVFTTIKTNQYNADKPFYNKNIPYLNMESLINTSQHYNYSVGGIPKGNTSSEIVKYVNTKQIKTIIVNFLGTGVISLVIKSLDKKKSLDLTFKISSNVTNNVNKVLVNF
jgi:hypothetical protein